MFDSFLNMEAAINFIKKETQKIAPVCNFTKKETLAQVLSCEFCEIIKNSFNRTPLDDYFSKYTFALKFFKNQIVKN